MCRSCSNQTLAPLAVEYLRYCKIALSLQAPSPSKRCTHICSYSNSPSNYILYYPSLSGKTTSESELDAPIPFSGPWPLTLSLAAQEYLNHDSFLFLDCFISIICPESQRPNNFSILPFAQFTLLLAVILASPETQSSAYTR